jgi:PAS domain S-box-containing protein
MLPYNEEKRLAALASSGLALAQGDGSLERLAGLVRDAFGVAMVAISSVERHDQNLLATCGLEAGPIPREMAFCSRTVALDKTTVILDASIDPRWSDNPLVTGGTEVRFYAGVPVRVGPHVVGTLCIMDGRPRNTFSETDRCRLEAFGETVVDLVRLHGLEALSRDADNRFVRMAEASPDGMILTNSAGSILFWNEGAERVFGFTADEAHALQVADLLSPRLKYRPGDFSAMFDRPVGSTCEVDVVGKDGRTLTAEFSLSRWREAGETRYGIVVRDVTARIAAEAALLDMAHRDALTGVPNRTVLMNRLGKAIEAGRLGRGLISSQPDAG